MEYADGGDLAQKINEHKNKGQYFKEAQIWDYFSQMASGLGRLHELGILHRDVKVPLVRLRVQTSSSRGMASSKLET